MSRLPVCGLVLALLAAPTFAADAKEDPAIKQIDAMIAKVSKEGADWKTKVPEPQPVKFEPGTKYFATMQTSEGPIKLQLLSDVAPMHVASFIYLSRLGFYDDLKFHRVIPDFMAQGGCPLGTGTGGPAFRLAGEYDAKVKHDRPGLLSAANTGQPKTDGSQFFLTFKPTPHLDGRHTIYGEVVEGLETLKKIEPLGSSPSGRTSKPITIQKVTIETQKS